MLKLQSQYIRFENFLKRKETVYDLQVLSMVSVKFVFISAEAEIIIQKKYQPAV